MREGRLGALSARGLHQDVSTMHVFVRIHMRILVNYVMIEGTFCCAPGKSSCGR